MKFCSEGAFDWDFIYAYCIGIRRFTWQHRQRLCRIFPLDLKLLLNCLRHLNAFLAILAYFCFSDFAFDSICLAASAVSCLLGVILIGREKINSRTNNNEIVKSQPLNSISWLWMCVTFYAHYAFKVCAYNRFTHKWYRTQHKISHVYATERVNERRYADYRAVCLGRCCCCCCACVCTLACDSIDLCDGDCMQLHKIALVQIQKFELHLRNFVTDFINK